MFDSQNSNRGTITTIILVVVIVLLSVGLVKSCKQNRDDSTEIDHLLDVNIKATSIALAYKDSMNTARSERDKGKAVISDQQKIVFMLKANAEGKRLAVLDRNKNLPLVQQRNSIIKTLVSNKTLPASRLVDTLMIMSTDTVFADSATVAAANVTIQWGVDLQNERDSLFTAASAYEADNKQLKQDNIGYRTETNNIKAILNILAAPCRGLIQNLFCRTCKEVRRAEKARRKQLKEQISDGTSKSVR